MSYDLQGQEIIQGRMQEFLLLATNVFQINTRYSFEIFLSIILRLYCLEDMQWLGGGGTRLELGKNLTRYPECAIFRLHKVLI